MIRAHLQRLGHAGVPVAQAHTLGQSQALEGGLHRGQVVETDMVPNLGSTSDTHGIPAAHPDDDLAFHDEMLVGPVATKVHANSIKVLRLESQKSLACFTMMQAPASTPTLSPKLVLLHFVWRRDDRLLVAWLTAWHFSSQSAWIDCQRL